MSVKSVSRSKHRSQRPLAQTAVYFRRCHICGAVTEKKNTEIKNCGECGKLMAPFYFFEDRKVEIFSTSGLRPEVRKMTDPSEEVEHYPLRGLTAYW